MIIFVALFYVLFGLLALHVLAWICALCMNLLSNMCMLVAKVMDGYRVSPATKPNTASAPSHTAEPDTA